MQSVNIESLAKLSVTGFRVIKSISIQSVDIYDFASI